MCTRKQPGKGKQERGYNLMLGAFGKAMKKARERALKRIGSQVVIQRNPETGRIEQVMRLVYIPGYTQGRL